MKKRTLLKTLLVAALVGATTAFAEGPIRGNPNSKVYHKPACRHYNAKSCTKEFKSEAEAQKAGYKACKQCCKPSTDKKSANKK